METYIPWPFKEPHFCLVFISGMSSLKVKYTADIMVLLILIFKSDSVQAYFCRLKSVICIFVVSLVFLWEQTFWNSEKLSQIQKNYIMFLNEEMEKQE